MDESERLVFSGIGQAERSVPDAFRLPGPWPRYYVSPVRGIVWGRRRAQELVRQRRHEAVMDWFDSVGA